MRSLTRKTTLGALLLVSSSLLPACWYKSFSRTDEEPATGGAPGDGGAGGESASGGNSSTGGSQTGTGGADSDPIETKPDLITVNQGAAVDLNVLNNDEGSNLILTSVDASDAARPASLDPEVLSFQPNGQVTFKAADDFWGVYRMTYEVEDSSGKKAEDTIEVQVVPTDIKLATLELGWGGFIIEGAAGDSLGTSIASAGDVNGDGLVDILVGAPSANSNAGRVALVLGRQGLAAIPQEQDLDLGSAEASVQIFEGIAGSYAGVSVAGAGDMNGDGFADLIIGAAFPPGVGPSSNGFAHVLWGNAQAPVAPRQLSATPPSTTGFTVQGESSERLGVIVTGGQDINGDGFDDMALYSTFNADSVHAIFGPVTEANVVNGDLSALADLSFTGATLRFSTALVGNVFNEGTDELAELLVATTDGFAMLRGATGGADAWPADTTLSPDEGWLSSAKPSIDTNNQPSVATAGEFDGTAGLDVVYCTGDDSCRIVPKTSDPTTYSLDAGRLITGFGAGSSPRVSGGGDTNGDGFDDLIFANDGNAYVVLGQETLPTAPLAVNTLGNAGYTIAPGSSTIGQVAVLGDVNGDALTDYAITVPSAAGRVYVIYGTPGSR